MKRPRSALPTYVYGVPAPYLPVNTMRKYVNLYRYFAEIHHQGRMNAGERLICLIPILCLSGYTELWVKEST